MTEHIGGEVEHTDVGAYALGLLEADDQRAFEAHLAGCDRCMEELADFSGMRELLTALDPVEPGADDPPPARGTGDVGDLLRRRRTAKRRQRRGTAVIGLAAGIALLAGGAVVGATVADRGSRSGHGHVPADLLAWGETRRATDARTGVAGIVAMEHKGWGTHTALDLTHVKGPLTCRLVAISKSGAAHVMTEWAVPPTGYGEPGAPDHLQVHGGTSLQRSDLRRFEVRDQSGATLLTIPV
ncbi:anti-sigma U factor RsuA [Actinoallomurus bryophytorum]|uniref:Putative zinc finger protein n=1 Tax=Actinoallomurus bryophytorum TaxID=1490222 RepID=A0A543C0L3_9ACTN|nr:zf-HC2 domain-containing protein [Actinoallomurus bryophytorum]TQL90617.1 putative zinc finger protein [Actinoallomurus bryophytorum]